MTQPRPKTDHATRFAHLETQVSNVAITLTDFIKDSKEHRDRIERDQTQIWTALREQADQLRTAVEKLSTKGQISWQMIFAAVSVLVALMGLLAGVNNAIVDGKIQRLEERDQAVKELREAKIETLNVRDEFILRRLDEDHQTIQSLLAK